MFWSSIIIREPALNLAKVIFMLKHSVKLRRYLLCSCVAACCQTMIEKIWSYSWKDQIIFFSQPKSPYRPWGAPNLLFDT